MEKTIGKEYKNADREAFFMVFDKQLSLFEE